MSRILITGGTGDFGRHLAPLLLQRGQMVCIASRRARRPGEWPEVEWAQASLGAEAGWAEALRDTPVVVHAASDAANSRAMDVDGTRRLLDHARQARVQHFFYISIVGIERHPLAYYQHKLATEHLIRASGLPWTILRATQFHSFVDRILSAALKWPWPAAFLPLDFQFQTMATEEVAALTAEAVLTEPGGLLPDMGGPEVWRVRDMAAVWLAAQGKRKILLPLWLPLAWAKSYQLGHNTCPERKVGKMTWKEWVKRKYG